MMDRWGKQLCFLCHPTRFCYLSERSTLPPVSLTTLHPSLCMQVCVSARVCPGFDWSSTLRGKWWPVWDRSHHRSQSPSVYNDWTQQTPQIDDREKLELVCVYAKACAFPAYRVVFVSVCVTWCVCEHECVHWCIEQSFLQPLSRHWLFCGACRLPIAAISHRHAPPSLGLSFFPTWPLLPRPFLAAFPCFVPHSLWPLIPVSSPHLFDHEPNSNWLPKSRDHTYLWLFLWLNSTRVVLAVLIKLTEKAQIHVYVRVTWQWGYSGISEAVNPAR